MCNGKVPHGSELSRGLPRRSFMRGAASIGGGILLGTELSMPGRGATAVNPEDSHPKSEPGQPLNNRGYIVDLEAGAAIGNHKIKADPETGSMRLGAGLQHLASGKGIPIHRHEHEDEILFIHSGAGIGVVGNTVKRVETGTTIYIPAGVWHGIGTQGSDVSVLWVVSPPNFARSLRDYGRLQSTGRKVKQEELDEIARRHGQQDARFFAAERLGNTIWHGDGIWGEVTFDGSGVVITYRGSIGSGRIVLVDFAPGQLSFVGEHTQANGSKTKITLRYDFASGNRIIVNWGSNLQAESTWFKAGITNHHE
jgi:quercetin dioxygenase-like cupin family protein